ncbi:MAG TPA: pantoate--beta-alanine ligase [bacterium]|nr:pantoate--beta-alanine ligase [bacterium]HOL47630.1 pantoate--beta-alanine ligase [bacterium]HPQ19620.1 pantoate--beta-alanine ligase [bacterium]
MKIIKNITRIKKEIKALKTKGKKIGFVPTMGYLHNGHISLIKKCRVENEICVISIFVNPKQFGPNEDLKKYPRDLKRDLSIAKKNKVDIVFVPDEKSIYPEDYKTYVEVSEYSNVYEGAFRQGHFKGVCTIVLKLFNIIEPDRVYFGQKDFQQALIIKKMIKDLNLDIEMKVLPTIRDANGLALSSRNSYLNEEQYDIALSLNKSLRFIKDEFKKGEKKKKKLINLAKEKFLNNKRISLDYIDIVDKKTLSPVKTEIKKGDVIIIAAKVDNIRLIDNLII